jgi:hypothetical protein
MTDSERAQILKMIEDGKISAEDGLKLMQALDNPPEEESAPAETGTVSDKPGNSDFEFNAMTERFRRLWMIPTYIGAIVLVIGAGLMYWAMQSGGFGFWFFCATMPFLLGLVVLAIGAGSRTSRWLFLDINEKPKKGRHRNKIVLGFPMPLGLAAWFFRNFSHLIPELRDKQVDEMIVALDQTTGESPLIVNVDEGEDGDRVRIFIG